MDKLLENYRKHLEYFCLKLGSKHCGSPDLEKAGEYIESYFRSMNLPTRREEFPVRGWRYNGFSLYDLDGCCEVPAATACYFSRGVDVCDVPFWIDFHNIDRLEELPVRGRICFVSVWTNLGNVFGRNAIAEKLDEMGAAGAIFISNGAHSDLSPSTKIQRSPFLKQLGTAAVAQRGAMYIANHKNNRYRLFVDADCFDTSAFNVIARIGNGTKRACVGAHYDTAPLVQGALDDIGGTCTVMEMARICRDLPMGDWAIDFAAFSAEEYIPVSLNPGSGDYIRRHQCEDLQWFLNIDDYTGHFAVPYFAISHMEKLPPLQLPSYEVQDISDGKHYNGDDKAFGLAGIPTIWMFADHCFRERHTYEDELSAVSYDRMLEGTKEYIDIYRQLVR